MFDDPNLVLAAGLVPALRLAESAGLHDLLEGLSVPSPNPGVKSASVLAGMLAGADSIDDLDLLRHGGMPRLFAGVRAPSTLGTFLRTFTHDHVQQLDKIGAGLLAGLAQRVPGLLAGSGREGIAFHRTPNPEPRNPGITKSARWIRAQPGHVRTSVAKVGSAGCHEQHPSFVDVDDTIRGVHGYAKQAAAYGYCGCAASTSSSPRSRPRPSRR